MRFVIGLSLFLFSSVSIFSQDNIALAKTHLIKNNQLKPSLKTENLSISSSHKSERSGLTHIYFNQLVNDIKIYNAITNVAIDDNGQIVHVGNRFVNYTSAESPKQSIDSKTALRSVASHFDMKFESETNLLDQRAGAAKETNLQNFSLSNKDINASLVYIEHEGQLLLSWSIALEKVDDKHWWDVKVSAVDGTILEKTSWTVECNFDHAEDACDHSNHKHSIKTHTSNLVNSVNSTASVLLDGDYTVIAMPTESPSHGPVSVVNSPWSDNIDPAAHPFDWHNDGTTTHNTTRGNNVWAVEDTNADNNQSAGFSPISQVGSLGQEYNFVPDFTDIPSNYQEAAITNLFYWNNIVHDVMHHYGFDEASGNFQVTNDTSVPGANDAVQADAQDGSSTNNANFSTPGDGDNPIMQMFEWTQSAETTFSVLTPFTDSYIAIAASFGPNATFAGTVVEADDTSGGTHENCSANPISNGAALSGNIALIDRGNCTFVEKVTNAENEGAIAVVICNNVPGGATGMSGTGTNIPSVMISQEDCAILRASLPASIDVVTSTSAPVNRDSDYDNGIIIHEYGHGISNRLTGGRLNTGCLNNGAVLSDGTVIPGEQMGEGWSDFFGLVLTMKPGDTGPQGRGIGTYVLGQPTTGNGIRPFPYSNDFGINPMTYASVETAAIPHGVGAVWCTMLWDMTWNFVDIYGIGTNIYDSDTTNAGTPGAPSTFGGQNLALQLVIEGLKLQPCSPGFVDGRDAIIAADQILYGGIHKRVIWSTFATRGLGVSAEQGSSGSVIDNVEAFDSPSLSIEKTVDPLLVLDGNSATYDLLIIAECGDQENIVITDVLDPAFTISSVVCPSPTTHTSNGNTLTINHPLLSAGNSLNCTVIVDINTGISGSPQNLLIDDAESGPGQWTIDNFGGAAAGEWTIDNSAFQSPANSWFASNTNGPDKTTAIESSVITLGSHPTLSFYHRYDTEEAWDGGFIEIKKVSDTNWSKILASEILQNSYNGILGASSNNNIANAEAWTGNSGGFIQSIVQLTRFANENVEIRFVFGQDDNTNSIGWWVDDISVDNGYVLISNTACVISDQTTTNICNDADLLVGLDAGCPPGSVMLDIVVEHESCTATADGTATVTPTGGVSPYTYLWSNGAVTSMITGLAPGSYTVTIDDSGSCQTISTIIINPAETEYTMTNGNMLTGTQAVDEDYEVDGSIESDQIISGGLTVDYDSGTDVTMKAGFEVISSSVFHAFIDGCGGSQ